MLDRNMPLARRLVAYLQDVLGIKALVRPWTQANLLPYHLRDTYDWSKVEILGRSCVVFSPKKPDRASLADMRKHADLVITAAPDSVPILLLPELSSFERRRLIEQQTPFIVPGNQLYLPDLALDLREYFRQRRTTSRAALSPATQALLICALLRQPWQSDWRAADDASRLGYTPMTVSRVAAELQGAGLAEVTAVGRMRHLHFAKPPEQVWQDAQAVLKSPVRRHVWVDGRVAPPASALRAGASALASQTNLADPLHPVWAVSAAAWRRAQGKRTKTLPAPMPDSAIWEVWSYGPRLLPDGLGVDPLSLILSLDDDPDERVQIALDELRETLPWQPLRD